MVTHEMDPGAVATRRKVVVVEDDPEIRDLECFLLATEGYLVVGLASGGGAADVIRREQPDLVLLDLMLPDKSGNEVLAELADDPLTAETPVVVASAYPSELQRTPQVKRLLPKPFELTDLLDAVAKDYPREPGP
jgi:CheY-like chemotaxis protein